MIKDVLLFVLFLFSVPIPIIPYVIWHVGKGIVQEVRGK